MGKSWERFRVAGDDLVRRVTELIHEGNVRRVVVKQGARTVAEFPVTVGLTTSPRLTPARPFRPGNRR